MGMIVVADSGSTKCDWAVINGDGKLVGSFNTMGLNPYFHSQEVIADTVQSNKGLRAVASQVSEVVFYGAGSSSDSVRGIVEHGLQDVFENAKIHVEHDLVGAALATYDGEPCITCILGTGSNSTYFDGSKIHEEVPALAYIIGDEGSSSYYGKQLLRDYFYKMMPQDIADSFAQEYGVTKDEVLHHVYREPHANVYLASFSKFMGRHADDEYVQSLLQNGVREFIDIHVACFSNYRDVPVHFIGSIAHHYQDVLKEVASDVGVRLGQIIQKPIDGLVKYHADKLRPSNP